MLLQKETANHNVARPMVPIVSLFSLIFLCSKLNGICGQQPERAAKYRSPFPSSIASHHLSLFNIHRCEIGPKAHKIPQTHSILFPNPFDFYTTKIRTMNSTRAVAMATSYFRNAIKSNAANEARHSLNAATKREKATGLAKSHLINGRTPPAHADRSEVRSMATFERRITHAFTRAPSKSSDWFGPVAGDCQLTGF